MKALNLNHPKLILVKELFLKTLLELWGGVVATLIVGEASKHVLPGTDGYDMEDGSDLGRQKEKVEINPYSYAEQLQRSVLSGYTLALEESLSVAKQRLNQEVAGADAGAVAGLAAGYLMHKGDPWFEADRQGEDHLNAEKILAPIGLGVTGMTAGVLKMDGVKGLPSLLRSKLDILNKQVRSALLELQDLNQNTNFTQTSDKSLDSMHALARKALAEIGLENFDPTDLVSIKQSAKEFAERHFNAILKQAKNQK